MIGATAAWLQGSPAVTVDLDVMPRREIDNADRLAEALNSLEARRPGADALAEVDGGDFLSWEAQRFETAAGPLDVVPRAAAIGGFEDVATVELSLGDITIRAIEIDAVIASKERLGRPKDVAALPALYSAREARRQRRESKDEA